MSKITFRADEDLVRRLEEFEASKSEVMREALRLYLDGTDRAAPDRSVDAAMAERVDRLVEERIDARGVPRDVNVTVTLDGATLTDAGAPGATATDGGEHADVGDGTRLEADGDGDTDATDADPQTARNTCGQCGEAVGREHVYCPNCGEKAARRVFCDCGDELRSDWAFCPGCGRRTTAGEVLDCT